MKMFKEMRGQKGFSLIELAIALVIIGIITGAVLKGQDLLESARIRSFDSSVREWETAVWTYLDRKGQFPGDSDKDAIIGDAATEESGGQALVNAKIVDATSANPLNSGSLKWWVYFGNDGENPAKNIMVVCGSIDCQEGFDDDQIQYVESFDAMMDGTANGEAGNVTCDSPSILTETASNTNERIVKDLAFATVGRACDNNLVTAFVYFFDRGSGL